MNTDNDMYQFLSLVGARQNSTDLPARPKCTFTLITTDSQIDILYYNTTLHKRRDRWQYTIGIVRDNGIRRYYYLFIRIISLSKKHRAQKPTFLLYLATCSRISLYQSTQTAERRTKSSYDEAAIAAQLTDLFDSEPVSSLLTSRAVARPTHTDTQTQAQTPTNPRNERAMTVNAK